MHIRVKEATNGEWYIVLVARNGEALMTSETYDSKSNAERAAYNIQEQWILPIEVRVEV